MRVSWLFGNFMILIYLFEGLVFGENCCWIGLLELDDSGLYDKKIYILVN